MTNLIKSYSELILLPTYEERFEYLKLDGKVGNETFGFDRYLNQAFYKSKEWLTFRRDMLIRDNGCDLACTGYEIQSRYILHHINPISVEDLLHYGEIILMNPENVITTIHRTHNAIHYGDKDLLVTDPIERTINDTCPWRH